MGFPKIRGTILGVPIRIIVFWGLYWGPLGFNSGLLLHGGLRTTCGYLLGLGYTLFLIRLSGCYLLLWMVYYWAVLCRPEQAAFCNNKES